MARMLRNEKRSGPDCQDRTAANTINLSNTIAETTLTTEQAQRLVTRIELRLTNIVENAEALLPLIEEAKIGNAHVVLGYRSWTEFVAEKFGGRLERLSRVERVPLVRLLADQGMSTRAIGAVVGASKDTVSRDIRAGVSDETPAHHDDLGVQDVAERGDEDDLDAALAGLRKVMDDNPMSAEITRDIPNVSVVGLDGKQYAKPAAKKNKRQRGALSQDYSRALRELQKAIDRIVRLHGDRRFDDAKEAVAYLYGAKLTLAASDLQEALKALRGDGR